MLLDDKPYTFDRVVRIGIGIAVLWGLVWLMGYLSEVLIPFAVALLLAYLINPFVCLVQKRIRNRVAAVLISLVCLLIVVTFLIRIVVPIVISEFAEMRTLVVQASQMKLSSHIKEIIPPDAWQSVQEYLATKDVQDFFKTDRFWKISFAFIRKALPGVWGIITGATSFLFWLAGLTIIFLYLVFLLIDYPKVHNAWTGMLPQKYRQVIIDFVEEFNTGMKRYFRGQAAVASIVGVLFAIGFGIIGLPMGVLLGLFIGLLNMVPYLQILGLIPAFFLALLAGLTGDGHWWMMPLLTALVFIVVQSTQDMFLVPKIMGKVTGLSPAVILLSLSIWGKLLGLFGLIIALPMTCLCLAYYRRFIIPMGVKVGE